MNEITRRELLRRTGHVLPLAVLSQIALAPFETAAQVPADAPPPLSPEHHDLFVELSALLTGYDKADLDPTLVDDYATRLKAFKGDLLVKVLEQYDDGGEAWVQERMTEEKCIYKKPPATNSKPLPSPPPAAVVPGNIVSDSNLLITYWQDNWDGNVKDAKPYAYKCDAKPPPDVVNAAYAGLVPGADYDQASPPDCKYSFMLQAIVIIWYISGIYRQAHSRDGKVNLVSPSEAFNYGTALGHVSALVFPTINGETHPYSAPNARDGAHPFAQCGGEFGYWEKKPRTI